MDSSPSGIGSQAVSRKSPCRYGRGCTHILDPTHLEKFRHPAKQELNADDIRRNYMCNECGLGYNSLAELQYHLQKKTAWSNESLVGCRISCLVDSKEWHEGLITQFHRSGKHCVEFRAVSEKRWFHMLKLAFYIIEPHEEYEKHEFKDSACDVEDCSSEIRNEWTYYEDISFDYAFTQSVLFKVYGGVVQETGHKTRGHVSLTEYDRYIARSQKGSLLYGELLPRGVNKALDSYHLDAAKAQVLFDMGMGTGKVAIQAFLQFRNLVYVYGVELSVGRYLVAEAAAMRMVQLLGQESFRVDVIHGEQIIITEVVSNDSDRGRTLKLQCGNMLEVKDLGIADIIMMETDIPAHLQVDLCTMLQHQMRDNAYILSYHDLYKIWPSTSYPFKQLDINCSLTDRFPTSWSVQRGHHFYLFRKCDRVNSKNLFQRHLKRNIGRSVSNGSDSSASTIAYKGVSCSPTQVTQVSGSPQRLQHLEIDSDDSVCANQKLSDTQYRECQAYATAFPSLPHQTNLRESTSYRDKEIPKLKINRSNHTAEVVDSSGCGCFCIPSWLLNVFTAGKRSNESNIVAAPVHMQDTDAHTHNGSALPPLQPVGTTHNNNQSSKVAKSPRPSHQQLSISPRTPQSPVKIVKLSSASPRSVQVEKSKTPRLVIEDVRSA